MESLQCDGKEERYCNCLRESAARAKALLSEVRVRTADIRAVIASAEGRSDE